MGMAVDKMLGKIRSCSLATLSLNAYLTSHQRCLVDSWILKPGVPGRTWDRMGVVIHRMGLSKEQDEAFWQSV